MGPVREAVRSSSHYWCTPRRLGFKDGVIINAEARNKDKLAKSDEKTMQKLDRREDEARMNSYQTRASCIGGVERRDDMPATLRLAHGTEKGQPSSRRPVGARNRYYNSSVREARSCIKAGEPRNAWEGTKVGSMHAWPDGRDGAWGPLRQRVASQHGRVVVSECCWWAIAAWLLNVARLGEVPKPR